MTNGNVYKGNFKNDMRDGTGNYLYFSTGEQYNGEWKGNIRSGFGTYIFAYG